eukprot:3536292-Amphidinium_carterae.1
MDSLPPVYTREEPGRTLILQVLDTVGHQIPRYDPTQVAAFDANPEHVPVGMLTAAWLGVRPNQRVVDMKKLLEEVCHVPVQFQRLFLVDRELQDQEWLT